MAIRGLLGSNGFRCDAQLKMRHLAGYSKQVYIAVGSSFLNTIGTHISSPVSYFFETL